MEWISTEISLPAEGERVLLYTPFPIFGEDYSCVGNTESIRACRTRVGKKTVPVFTHWMPLPGRPASH